MVTQMKPMTDRRTDDRSVMARNRALTCMNPGFAIMGVTDDSFSHIPALTYARIRARVTRARIARECGKNCHLSSVTGRGGRP